MSETQVDNSTKKQLFVPHEVLILNWDEMARFAVPTAVSEFASLELEPPPPPTPRFAYNQWVLDLTSEFEPSLTPPLALLAAPRNEFEQCCAPCIGAHGAPYLTAAEINAILSPTPTEPTP